jgi:hypothetical protein
MSVEAIEVMRNGCEHSCELHFTHRLHLNIRTIVGKRAVIVREGTEETGHRVRVGEKDVTRLHDVPLL